MNFSVKLFLLIVSFLVLGVWAVQGENTLAKKNEYQLRVVHPNGEQTIMDVKAPCADGDASGKATTPSPSAGVNKTALSECEVGSGCCFQFTWPGQADTGDTSWTCRNASDSREPCKEPIVFTTSQGSTQYNKRGRRPDVNELVEYCKLNGCTIYCERGVSSCIKYSFYLGQELWNETRFCGQVNSKNTEKPVTSGCYQEKLSNGYTREVCVCNGRKCNSALASASPSVFAVLGLLLIQKGLRSCFL